MVNLTGILSRLAPIKAVVIGDLMLDTYTIGRAMRISPEAPVAVVNVVETEHRVGGAGNVALNLVALGADVQIVGRIGSDSAGEQLHQLFEAAAISSNSGLWRQLGYSTPIKNRIIADNQQIVRVDHEKVEPLTELLEQQIIDTLPLVLNDADVIAISDYGKGFLSAALLGAVIEIAKAKAIPVIADPKGVDFAKYSGVTLLKPNAAEAYAAAGLPTAAALGHVADKLLATVQVDALMITRSGAGIALFTPGGSHEEFPVRIREVKDVTGAGDTVLAMVACAMANGIALGQACQLANIAAGIAIEKLGCARVTLSDLAQRLLELDFGNKVFDADHLFALKQALVGQRVTVLSVSSVLGMTPVLLRQLCQYSKEHTEKVLLYVRDESPSEEFISMLAALRMVDFIVLTSIHAEEFFSTLPSHQLVALELVHCS
jgi:D-beta-D-heptose 7-phosphate kinase/D-beta-D-heptose 1-phosphate adenosyltransferase